MSQGIHDMTFRPFAKVDRTVGGVDVVPYNTSYVEVQRAVPEPFSHLDTWQVTGADDKAHAMRLVESLNPTLNALSAREDMETGRIYVNTYRSF